MVAAAYTKGLFIINLSILNFNIAYDLLSVLRLLSTRFTSTLVLVCSWRSSTVKFPCVYSHWWRTLMAHIPFSDENNFAKWSNGTITKWNWRLGKMHILCSGTYSFAQPQHRNTETAYMDVYGILNCVEALLMLLCR